MRSFVLAVCPVLIACGPRITPLDTKDIERPELLVDTQDIESDFTARQKIEAQFGERRALFQAIVQKSGDRLVVVGLTPQGQRAFVLEQRGRIVSFEESPGIELPFSPWHILVDIHRGVFRGGGPEPTVQSDGDHRVAHPVEPMVETWKDGVLVRRTIRAHGRDNGVVINYAEPRPGPLYQRPTRFKNTRVGYTLTITPL